jgi:hypothetical protein
MNRTRITLFCVSSVVACRGREPPEAAQAHRPSPAIACNPNGLTESERREQTELLARMATAISRIDELSDGYTFRVDEAHLPLPGLSRWIDLERRCCPFFHLDLEVVPADGGTWLHLTGASGVKEFIQSELAAKVRS